MQKLERDILRFLRDEYLHSIAEIVEAVEASREEVKAVLYRLQNEDKVFTMRRRWSV
jgi:DNA-binding Lrp family transcriptional regulator